MKFRKSDIVQVCFTQSVRRIPIFADPHVSDPFYVKYDGTCWDDHHLKHAEILGIKKIGNAFYYQVCFVDDSPTYNVYLAEVFLRSLEICRCNVWISGCKCGIFQRKRVIHDLQKC